MHIASNREIQSTIIPVSTMLLCLTSCASASSSDTSSPEVAAVGEREAVEVCDEPTIKRVIMKALAEQQSPEDGLQLKSVQHCDGALVAAVMKDAFRASESAFGARGGYYDAVMGVAQGHVGELQACYEQQLVENPELSGRIEIELTIGASGAVDAAKITTDHLASESLTACLQAVVQQWAFPATEDAPVIVEIPLDFSPQAPSAEEPAEP